MKRLSSGTLRHVIGSKIRVPLYAALLAGAACSIPTAIAGTAAAPPVPVPATAAPATNKSDVSGTWKWSYSAPGGQPIEVSLKLKQDGEKLTGTLIGRYGETEIQEGKTKDGKVSFKVTREGQGEKITVLFHGDVAAAGDAIDGKADVTTNGQSRSSEWNAKRADDSAEKKDKGQ